MSSCRKYVYGKTHEGVSQFLVSVLDISEGMRYCKKHAKVFRHTYDHYLIGSFAEELDKWIVYKPEDS